MMHPIFIRHRQLENAIFTSICAGILASASPTQGAVILEHRYSFSGNANDSVGTAHGSLLANGTIGADLLSTTNTAAGATGVSLPAAAIAGLSGDFSIEQYASAGSGAGFQALFGFSTDNTTYLVATPNRITGGGVSGLDYNPLGGGTGAFSSQNIIIGINAENGTTTQFVTTYNATTGTASYYINGTFQASASVPGFNLEVVGTGSRTINGNQFDPGLNGSTDDFRIFSGTLDAGQVSALAILGPDASTAAIVAAVPEPGVTTLLLASALALLRGRRFNRESV